MSESPHQISIALVTRNRPASLERALKSLRGQEVQPLEVVVSDDSDEAQAGKTREVVEAFGGKYIAGPRRGLYANRNHVALACRGTHIRSMDDDHEFPPGHFAHCAQAVAEDPQSVWIIGEFKPGQAIRLPISCPGQLNARGFSVLPADRQNCWAISDGASIYPRRVFDEGNRFAEDFKFGVAYLEFGSRLHWLGYRLRLMEDTWIVHHMDRNNRSFMDNQMDRASSNFAMFCHSLIYQPTPSNRLACFAQAAKQFLRPRSGWRPLRMGWQAYRRRRALPRPHPRSEMAGARAGELT